MQKQTLESLIKPDWRKSTKKAELLQICSHNPERIPQKDHKKEKIENNIIKVKDLSNQLNSFDMENQLSALNTISLIAYKTVRLIKNYEKQKAKEMVTEILDQGYSFERITVKGFDFHVSEDNEVKERI